MSLNKLKSSIGRKVIVAVTGLLLLGFVIAHMLGNLQIFLGQDAINEYAVMLRSMPEVLWMARVTLLAAFVIHIIAAVALAAENKAARPLKYSHEATARATYASRIMVMSGILILFYVIYHLGHFTTHHFHSEYSHYVDPEGRHDVYSMIVAGFQDYRISGVYIVSMAVLSFHLSQAAAVFPQSMGWGNEKNLPLYTKAGTALALIVFIGYSAIPAAAYFGWLKLPESVSR